MECLNGAYILHSNCKQIRTDKQLLSEELIITIFTIVAFIIVGRITETIHTAKHHGICFNHGTTLSRSYPLSVNHVEKAASNSAGSNSASASSISASISTAREATSELIAAALR